jgi:hypothetical protein
MGTSRRGSVWRYQLDHIPCERGAWFGTLGYATFIDECGLPLNTKFLFYPRWAGLTSALAFHWRALYDLNNLRSPLSFLAACLVADPLLNIST